MEPYVINYAKFMWTNLVDAEGNFHSSVHIKTAKDAARDAGLDLVCFSEPEKDKPAWCKIVDFGKWKYHQEKTKKKESSTHRVETKEIQFTPVIGDHDVEHKVRQIIKFLEEGDEVMVNMRFKGIHHRLKAEGDRIINLILTQVGTHGKEVSRKRSDDNIFLKLTR